MSLNEELALATKLKALGVKCSAFNGLTSFDQRRESMRAAVKEMPDVLYATRDGKNITLRQQFERTYGCDLEPSQPLNRF